jgi:glycyl-tRNA synthetase
MSDKKDNKGKPSAEPEVMDKIVSMCKQRGFVFQSSEIYGGLKSCYDYGPLGAELKRNVKAEWWRSMVHSRKDVVGLDASIIMHPNVWRASGHLAGFTDPMVDCKDCKERGRADKWPAAEAGSEVEYKVIVDHKSGKKESRKGTVGKLGIVCPNCGAST